MFETRQIVCNTGPLIALIAGVGNLGFLKDIYSRVIVPCEVCREILEENATRFGANIFQTTEWLDKRTSPTSISSFLSNALDKGESSVIQLALNENIPVVCIDESVGRRIARLNGLFVTGSLGILLKAKKMGLSINLPEVIDKMRKKGIWLDKELERLILTKAEEL
jgi:predicted nucleic acid-binding protein